MAVRMLYTRYARTHDKIGLSAASNAAPPSYEKNHLLNDTVEVSDKLTAERNASLTSVDSASSSVVDLTSSTPHLNAPIAIFPQYLTHCTTTLTIREIGFPQFSDSFTVSNGTEELFDVRRERPALGWRQHITDSKTNAPIMAIRRNLGQLPVSYRCIDPDGAKVLDIQGSFSLPRHAKSSAFLLNTENGEKVELSMRGGYRNRYATIRNKATDEVLVEVKSDIFEGRNVVGGRRTYEVIVRAGVDLALAVAMIVALDARAD